MLVESPSMAWPHWMLRLIAASGAETLADLMDSVRDETPRGGVSRDEAAAVSRLIDAHRYENTIPAQVFDSTLDLVRDDPDKSDVLQLFRLYDSIVASPEAIPPEIAARGLEIAERGAHDGARARFLAIRAQVEYEAGNIEDALQLSRSAFALLSALLPGDTAYLDVFQRAAINTVAYCTMEGDFETARCVRNRLVTLAGPTAGASITIPACRPDFPADPTRVAECAGDYLERGDELQALEWFQESVRLAHASEDEVSLCGTLGDMAVAFRRLGNLRRAIETYEEAIRLSRKHSDWVNLSRWSQNLGSLLLEHDPDRASVHLKEGLQAAARSGEARQISAAAGNYTGLLVRQQRFAEAMESLDEAVAAEGGGSELAAFWQSQRMSVLLRWGQQLRGEGQTDKALEVLEQAATAANMDDPKQKEAAAFAWTLIAELHERSGQLEAARESVNRAVALYRELGDDERADELERLSKGLSRGRKTVGGREAMASDSAALEKDIRAAVEIGDTHAEATARMNYVADLRLQDDSRTEVEFERTLALVRRLRDRRRELILCINFAPYFLEKAATGRALALADRGVRLAGTADPGSLIYALANRAQVWLQGKDNPDAAIADFQQCSELLRTYIAQNPDEQQLPKNVTPALLQGAQLALQRGDTQLAVAIASCVDPAVAALAEKRGADGGSRAAVPDVAALRELHEPELDRVLTVWHADGPSQSPPADPLCARLAGLADTLGWHWAAERFAREVRTNGAASSHPGAAGLLRLAEMLLDGTILLEAAIATARGLAIPDEDLDCIALFALNDRRRASGGVTIAAWRLLGAIATPACSARCYRLLGMFTTQQDPQAALEHFQAGVQALAGTDLVSERASLLMEAGALLAGPLRRFEQALPVCELALQLAEESGRQDIAANAMGNLALALLNLGHAEQAAERFESLAALQREIGDTAGLEHTQFNLQLAYRSSGKSARMHLDPNSNDPDVVFTNAMDLALASQYPDAIREFERGIAMLASSDRPYASRGQVLMNFARTLLSAGDTGRSIATMKAAVADLESAGHAQDLHDALAWLAAVLIEDETEGLAYAQRALTHSRKLRSNELLAIDLAQLGQNRLAARRPEEAIGPLEAAAQLSQLGEIRSALAQALTGVGRTVEARAIYEELLGGAADTPGKVSLLLGLSQLLEKSGDPGGALARLQEARDLTAGTVSREGAFVANSLGPALLRMGRLEDAAATLEDGIKSASALGLQRLELSLLSNFGEALKELGDLDAAEASLVRAQEGFRALGNRASEAISLAALGNVSLTRRDSQQALARYQEAADLAHEVDAGTEAACLDSLGMIYTQLGKPERAVEYHRRAAQLHEALQAWDSLLVDLVNIGQTYTALDEMQAAGETLTRARRLAQDHELSHWGLPLLAGLIAQAERRWKESMAHFREAIETVEGIRGSLPSAEAQRQWATRKADIYRFGVEAALEAHDGEAAVEFIECSRARYLKAILDRRAHRPPGVDDNTWLRYERAADRQAQVRSRNRVRMAAGDELLDRDLHEAQLDYQRAVASIEAATDPAAAGADFEFPAFADLIARIPVGHAAVWIAKHGRSLGLVCAGTNATGSTWSNAQWAPDQLAMDLDELIRGNRAVILERVQGRAVRDSDILFEHSLQHTCRWLGEHFWPVVEAQLPEGTNGVVLLPSAGLNVLPLHAALRPSGSRVDEQYCISYLPSLAMTAGYPVSPATRRLGQVVNPSEDPSLAFSALEAAAVARVFAGRAAVSRLDGRKATAPQVLKILESSDVFHFGGHAFYNTADPFRSGLVCANPRDAQRVLTLSAVLQQIQSIPSRLVVLSACETGRVEADDVLDDFLGLPGAFMVAGAQTVVASLWRVDDLATSLLISRYFEIWQDGQVDPARALGAAQKWLRSEVRVSDVVARLQGWKAQSEQDNEVLREALWSWIARDDQQSLAFPEESAWAAFYVTGLPAGGPSVM